MMILILISFFTACKNNSKEKELINFFEVQLDKSNKGIDLHTNVVLRSLGDKANDPITKEKAGIWFPKADSIAKFSTALYDYLELLKKKGEINPDAVKEFSGKLKEYGSQMLAVDERIRIEFENNQFLLTCTKDSLSFRNKSTLSNYLTTLNETTFSAMLTNIQNNIRIIENKTINFCNEQSTSHWHHDNFYSALIG
jgi:hypothetical protein